MTADCDRLKQGEKVNEWTELSDESQLRRGDLSEKL
jgi:hypothetical protein